ncbi:MAG: hypothetical protein FWH38_03105 [Treponema sp.]|nr:hypothetical protein [Treponema sp.]
MKVIAAVNRRRLIIRLILAAVWTGLGVLIFLVNRGHTVLVDNGNVAELELIAPDLIKVTLDGKNSLEFFRGDRDIFKVAGSRHFIAVEFSDGKPPFETDFRLPLGPDMFLLSVPKMINGIEPYIEIFHTRQESRSDDEAPVFDPDSTE